MLCVSRSISKSKVAAMPAQFLHGTLHGRWVWFWSFFLSPTLAKKEFIVRKDYCRIFFGNVPAITFKNIKNIWSLRNSTHTQVWRIMWDGKLNVPNAEVKKLSESFIKLCIIIFDSKNSRTSHPVQWRRRLSNQRHTHEISGASHRNHWRSSRSNFRWLCHKNSSIVEVFIGENLFLKVKSWSGAMCARKNPTATSACTAKRKSAPTVKVHTWTSSVVRLIE